MLNVQIVENIFIDSISQNLISASSVAFAALIWWVVPGVAVLGAIIYLTYTSRFKKKFEEDTYKSVTDFKRFQESFREGNVDGASQSGFPAQSADNNEIDSNKFTGKDKFSKKIIQVKPDLVPNNLVAENENSEYN